MKRHAIGLLGGTFDPIHFGHLHLALSLQERHSLEQVLVCPAFLSPYKIHQAPHVDTHHRCEMVKRAIEPLPTFAMLDYEVRRESPSFAIDTIEFLQEKYAKEQLDVQIHLLLGDDMLAGFAGWKDFERLAELAKPLIGSRNASFSLPAELTASVQKNLQRGLTQIPVMEISSTALRERLKKKLYCGHLVPAKVLDYIHQHQLYHS